MKRAFKPPLCKLIVESPSGHASTAWLPLACAWAAARAIAQHTHYDATLIGTYATASFRPDGTGQVAWNERSAQPGTTTAFSTNAIVCIS